ncbi:hypothetical protein CORT_0C00305 [Candida orthopsilosis Co 90-125]|uniref:Uncharacterized protein n=1 Tax=Candida orthopsilosis (strain 90-125) TaxID=1136231 RepID=H8X3D6_CANO9|nr:hypothetical protein CORT_0C00305 [Candida orthopsilosis Co 90-125]CCG25409.1 hypothetical protein CORT_0C00305 [Candida orthopsilosis Co 90-125]
MKIATCKFTTIATEQLDLSKNVLEDVNSVFPKNSSTNLKVFSLEDNKSSRFSMTSIGYGENDVQHGNLRELWFIGNYCKDESQKDKFAASLPKLVKYLWLTERVINWYSSRDHMLQNELSGFCL